MRAVALLCCLAVSSCTLANMTPTARFQDAAYTLNDAARWGQVDIAAQYVSPKYLESFVSRHRTWGEDISIADVELVRMQLAEDRQSASSLITLNWYDTHGVTLRSSTIAQRWEAEKGNFRLVEEKLSGGDPRIFAEAEPATAGAAAAP
jgi:hypothetical protein